MQQQLDDSLQAVDSLQIQLQKAEKTHQDALAMFCGTIQQLELELLDDKEQAKNRDEAIRDLDKKIRESGR
jgi:hypothetical protein